jgi:hypothetical protein
MPTEAPMGVVLAAGLLAASAYAASPGALVQAVLQTAGDRPEVVAACGPVSELSALVAADPALAALFQGHPTTGIPGAAWSRVTNPEPGKGVDRAGAIGITRWTDGTWRVDLPFSGTRTDVAVWFDTLAGVVATRGQGWNLVDKGVVTDATLNAGSLGMWPHGGSASKPGRSNTQRLLDGLPGSGGCVVYQEVDAGAAKLATATWYPQTRGDAVRVRVGGTAPPLGPPGSAPPPVVDAPVALAEGGADPVSGSSVTPPDLVVTLGVPWTALAGLGTEAGPLLPAGLVARAGATVARLPGGLVAVLPVEVSGGPRLSAEKLTKILRAEPLSFAEGSVVDAIDGALVVGPAPLVAEVVARRGTPWVDDDLRTVARSSPVAAGAPGRAAAAARAVPGGWEFTLNPSGGAPTLLTDQLVALARGPLDTRHWLVHPTQ